MCKDYIALAILLCKDFFTLFFSNACDGKKCALTVMFTQNGPVTDARTFVYLRRPTLVLTLVGRMKEKRGKKGKVNSSDALRPKWTDTTT